MRDFPPGDRRTCQYPGIGLAPPGGRRLPTCGSAGGKAELREVRASADAALLLPRRVYALILGWVLIARAALGGSLKRLRYNPTSSLNVRSQP